MDELVWQTVVGAADEEKVEAVREKLRKVAVANGLSPSGLISAVAAVWKPTYKATTARSRKPDLSRVAAAGAGWAYKLDDRLLNDLARDDTEARQLAADREAVRRIVERLKLAKRKTGRRSLDAEKALYDALEKFWLASGKDISRTWTDTRQRTSGAGSTSARASPVSAAAHPPRPFRRGRLQSGSARCRAANAVDQGYL